MANDLDVRFRRYLIDLIVAYLLKQGSTVLTTNAVRRTPYGDVLRKRNGDVVFSQRQANLVPGLGTEVLVFDSRVWQGALGDSGRSRVRTIVPKRGGGAFPTVNPYQPFAPLHVPEFYLPVRFGERDMQLTSWVAELRTGVPGAQLPFGLAGELYRASRLFDPENGAPVDFFEAGLYGFSLPLETPYHTGFDDVSGLYLVGLKNSRWESFSFESGGMPVPEGVIHLVDIYPSEEPGEPDEIYVYRRRSLFAVEPPDTLGGSLTINFQGLQLGAPDTIDGTGDPAVTESYRQPKLIDLGVGLEKTTVSTLYPVITFSSNSVRERGAFPAERELFTPVYNETEPVEEIYDWGSHPNRVPHSAMMSKLLYAISTTGARFYNVEHGFDVRNEPRLLQAGELVQLTKAVYDDDGQPSSYEDRGWATYQGEGVFSGPADATHFSAAVFNLSDPGYPLRVRESYYAQATTSLGFNPTFSGGAYQPTYYLLHSASIEGTLVFEMLLPRRDASGLPLGGEPQWTVINLRNGARLGPYEQINFRRADSGAQFSFSVNGGTRGGEVTLGFGGTGFYDLRPILTSKTPQDYGGWALETAEFSGDPRSPDATPKFLPPAPAPTTPPEGAPRITRFEVFGEQSPYIVDPDRFVYLYWEVLSESELTSLVLLPAGLDMLGQSGYSIKPDYSTRYTLRATNVFGTAERTFDVVLFNSFFPTFTGTAQTGRDTLEPVFALPLDSITQKLTLAEFQTWTVAIPDPLLPATLRQGDPLDPVQLQRYSDQAHPLIAQRELRLSVGYVQLYLRNPLAGPGESRFFGLTWQGSEYVCDAFRVTETEKLVAVAIANTEGGYQVLVAVDNEPVGSWPLAAFFPTAPGGVLKFLDGSSWPPNEGLSLTQHYNFTHPDWPFYGDARLTPFSARLKNTLTDKAGTLFTAEAADCPVVLYLEAFNDE